MFTLSTELNRKQWVKGTRIYSVLFWIRPLIWADKSARCSVHRSLCLGTTMHEFQARLTAVCTLMAASIGVFPLSMHWLPPSPLSVPILCSSWSQLMSHAFGSCPWSNPDLSYFFCTHQVWVSLSTLKPCKQDLWLSACKLGPKESSYATELFKRKKNPSRKVFLRGFYKMTWPTIFTGFACGQLSCVPCSCFAPKARFCFPGFFSQVGESVAMRFII